MLEKNIDRQQSKTRFSGTYTSFVKTSFQKEVQNDNMKKNRSLETSRRIELEVESRTQKILKLLTVWKTPKNIVSEASYFYLDINFEYSRQNED